MESNREIPLEEPRETKEDAKNAHLNQVYGLKKNFSTNINSHHGNNKEKE